MAEMTSTEKKNALIGEIGALMLSDPELADSDWDALCAVANISDSSKKAFGYRFSGDQYQGWVPKDRLFRDKIADLQTLMSEDEERAWQQVLINITKESMSIDIQFEYDDPTRWSPKVKSLDMSEFAFSLRPAGD